MIKADVTTEMTNADTPPEEAATAIRNAKTLGMSPSGYRSMAAEAKPLAEQEQLRPETENAPFSLLSWVGGDPVKASLAKPDLKIINESQGVWDYIKDTIRATDTNRRLSTYGTRLMFGDKLTPEEDINRQLLYGAQDEINKRKQKYDYNFVQDALAQVPAVGIDMVQGLVEQKAIVGAGAGAGAVGGAALGALELNPVSVVAGAAMGGLRGGVLGARAAMAADTFNVSTGGIYNELLFSNDGEISKLPEEDRRALAIGGGLAMTAVDFIGDTVVAKSVPWLKKVMSPKAYLSEIVKPQNAGFRAAIVRIGKAMAANSAEEMTQEAIEMITEAAGQSWDGEKWSFLNGLNALAQKKEESLKRIGSAGFVGGLAGGAFSTIGNVPSMLKSKRFNSVTGTFDENPKTDIVGDNVQEETRMRGERAVKVANAIRELGRLSTESKMKKISPESMSELRQQMVDDVGIPFVYMDVEDLKKAANTDEKAKKILDIIDDTGVAAAQLNAPVRLETHKFMDLVDEDPGLADHVKIAPEELTAAQYTARVKEADAKRAKLLEHAPSPEMQKIEAKTDEDKSNPDILDRSIKGHEQHIEFQTERLAELEAALPNLVNPEDTVEIEGKTLTRDQVAAQIKLRQGLVEESVQRIEALQSGVESRIQDADIFDEQAFLEQQTYTKEIEGVISKEEVDRTNEALKQARLGVIEAVDDAAANEQNQVKDLLVEMDLAEEREQAAARVLEDPNIQIVEDFINNAALVTTDLNEDQQLRVQSGYPAWAINPESLNDAQRSKYLQDPAMTARKVFTKKGVDINEAVIALNVPDSNTLLEVLSKTPTREQAINEAAQIRKGVAIAEADMAVDLNETAIAKAYNKLAETHWEEMKVMKDKEWSVTKQLIRRVALPLPRIGDIKARAEAAVRSSKVKELNVNQWKVAERKSQTIATKSITDLKVEKAFAAKQAAVESAYLAGETHVAIGKVNRAAKRIAKLLSPRGMRVFEEAGGTIEKAAKELSDLFFFKNTDVEDRIQNYQKFAEQMEKNGQGDYTIPPEVVEWLNDKKSAKDLTVDQYLYLHTKLEQLYHQARLKNRLSENVRLAGLQQTVESLENIFEDYLSQHPSYDTERANRTLNPVGFKETVEHKINAAASIFTNPQFVLMELDNDEYNGLMTQTFWNRLMGIGQYENSGQGITQVDKDRSVLRKRFDEIIKRYGAKEFKDLGRVAIDVPEFKNSPGLRKGKLKKLDLIMLLTHMGNEENRSRVRNFGVSTDTVMNVLERELTVNDFSLVQELVWDTFDSYKERIRMNELSTTGVAIDFVKPSEFIAHGKKFRGGYMPIKYANMAHVDALVEQNLKRFEGDEEGAPRGANYEGIVHSPFTKERAEISNRQLNLDFATLAIGLDEVVYDLGMRIPVRESMKLLTNKKIATAIMNVVGPEKFGTLVDGVREATNSMAVTQTNLYAQHQSFVRNAIGYVKGVASISWIAFNMRTLGIQFTSLGEAWKNMGAISGAKHFIPALVTMFNPARVRNWKGYAEFVEKIDPSISRYKEMLDDHTYGTLLEFQPQKRIVDWKAYHGLAEGRKAMAEFAFRKLLGKMDVTMKQVTVLAAYRQFLAGDVDAWPASRLAKMSDSEKYEAARAYAAQISSSSLTAASSLDRAPFQKTTAGEMFASYWNDGRNALNTNIKQVRKVRKDVAASTKLAKEGKYLEAAAKFESAGDRMMTTILLASMSGIYASLLYGQNPFQEEEDGKDKELTLEETIDNVPDTIRRQALTMEGPKNLVTSMFLNHTPVIRDVMFVKDALGGKENPTTPVQRFLKQAVVDSSKAVDKITQDNDDFVSMLYAMEDLNAKDFKGLLSALSLFVGGIPVNGVVSTVDNIMNATEGEGPLVVPMGLIAEGFNQSAKLFLSMPKAQQSKFEQEVAEAQAALKNEDPKYKIDNEFDAIVKEIRDKIRQRKEEEEDSQIDTGERSKIRVLKSAKGEHLTAYDYEVIRGAESRMNDFAENPNSGAFGAFQFVASTWEDIAKAAPELRLNPDLQLSTFRQQERAARWYVENRIVPKLKAAGKPVNADTVYGGWHFGENGIVTILKASDKTSIKKVLSPTAIKQNPQLAAEGVRTVRDLKRYISKAVNRGRRVAEKYVDKEQMLVDTDE